MGLNASTLLSINQVHLESIAALARNPPMAARGLAMMHIAMDDTFENNTKWGCSDADAHSAVAHSAYVVLSNLYPTRQAVFDSFFSSSLTPSNKCMKAAAEIANTICQSRLTDGSAVVTPYAVQPMPSWQPTGSGDALLPGWGNLKPFAIQTVNNYVLDPPPAPFSIAWYAALAEVKTFGSNSSIRLPDQTNSVHFWSSGKGTFTPPGQWNVVAQALVRIRNPSYRYTLKLFRVLNVVLADTSIAAWKNKYTYTTCRPSTIINYMAAGSTAPLWKSLIPEPPFPEYVSGHSSFSGAAGEVLKKFFPLSFFFNIDYAHQIRGFWSIDQAVLEAGHSRVLGGIHFGFSDKPGQEMGRRVAQEVMTKMLLDSFLSLFTN